MPVTIDETGNKYGRLTVVGKADKNQNGAMWVCECDCGGSTTTKGSQLRSGHTKSCGCLQREISAEIAKGRRKYPQECRTRTYKLMSKYGITEDDYIQMLQEQNFKCAICQTEADYQGRSLAVDHCHDTGVVRGLLCQKCNIGIGHFKDDITLLAKAIQYLQETN